MKYSKEMSQCLWVLIFLTLFIIPASIFCQIPILQGDLLQRMDEIKANMPGRESNGFVKPTSSELAQLGTLSKMLLDGQYTQANNFIKANFPFYKLYRFVDTGYQDKQYYLLQENVPISKGWGTFLINPAYHRELLIEAPHSMYEVGTHREGADIFRQSSAHFYLMNGTHRCANREVSGCSGTTGACRGSAYPLSDQAHYHLSLFQVIHEAVTRTFPNSYTIQIHGHGGNSCGEDFFFSNGHKTLVDQKVKNLVAALRAAGGVTAGHPGDTPSGCSLVGSWNVQGRFTNGSPDICKTSATSINGRFIHLEQSRRVRSSASEYRKLIQAINTHFPKISSAKLGDVNHDGVVNITDALITAQASVGLTPNPYHRASADVHGCDGMVNIIDALVIAKYDVGLIHRFPCGSP